MLVNVAHFLHFLKQEKDQFQEMGISQQLEREITAGPRYNVFFSVIEDTIASWHIIYA